VSASEDDAAAAQDAGEFGAWLRDCRAALWHDRPANVPCGTCTACCRASHFVTVRASDVAARRLIPRALLVADPGGPPGQHVLGYDAHGRCPMLQADGCAIYQDRPHACRSFDCRVYAAAGVDPPAAATGIRDRVRAWRFRYADDEARRAHDAVRRAADFIVRHADRFPGGRVPTRPVDLAVAAVEVYAAFLDTDAHARDPAEQAALVVTTRRAFDPRR
jgi:hypothetical protein